MTDPSFGQPRPALVWFRRDLRLADNPAVAAAAASGRPLAALFVLGAEEGTAARWWLRGSLAALSASLAEHGVRLLLRRGDPETVVPDVARNCGADVVYWNRLYEPVLAAGDERVRRRLASLGIATHDFNANLLFEPWTVQSRSGEPFRIFANFHRASLRSGEPAAPCPAPRNLIPFSGELPGDKLDDWPNVSPPPDWIERPDSIWPRGEAGAIRRLRHFKDRGLAGYATERDRPDRAGTSRLSPHLHWGEIGPRQIWHAASLRAGPDDVCDAKDRDRFRAELGWREFAYHLLHHNPHLAHRPLRPEFEHFPWIRDDASLNAWKSGQTGYPIIDAGMRELRATGWIHNRVRMIVASFLVKHLLQPWQSGAAWFLDRLVDADLANNALGWQWVAGSGVDSAPWFRIFNPTLQGQRHDPKGAYVRQWVPELARLPDDFVHRPWQAPALLLDQAGVRLGRDYPRPIVDHGEARRRALTAMYELRDRARAKLI